MLGWFEKRVDVFVTHSVRTPPKAFFAFLWHTSRDMRPFVLGMTLCTAFIGASEAWLFGLMSSLVDRLSKIQTAQLWESGGGDVVWLVFILAASPVAVGVQTLLKHQVLAVNLSLIHISEPTRPY